MHATTTQGFFNQTESYFSASQGQLIPLDQMPMPWLKNALSKLVTEYGKEVLLTPLGLAMMARLAPGTRELERILRNSGEAVHYVGEGAHDVRNARNKFYRAARRMGRKVTTHREGNWVKGTCQPDTVNIRVKER